MEILIITLGLLPGFAWLIFFLKEDIHPEPKKMIAKVFIVGAAFTFVVLAIEWVFQNLLGRFSINSKGVFSFSALSAIEELFKFLAAYLLVRKSRFFDEPIDAMIYMIVAALGFASVENVAVALNIFSGAGGGFGMVAAATVHRFVGATLLHALSSGTLGFYWARGIIKRSVGQGVVLGLIASTALHTIFNEFILIFKEVLIYPIIFLIIVAFFVFYDFEKLKKIC